MDDALDDDYEMEEEELLEAPTTRRRVHEYQSARSQQQSRSTVKSILWAGLSVSFGSVAQCGLLGGVAQFVWSQIRKVEAAQSVISERRLQLGNNGSGDGFRGMQIGGGSGGRGRRVGLVWGKLNQLARGFVRRYSDLAMSHVAAYYKNYHRAARDVAALVEQSGTCTGRLRFGRFLPFCFPFPSDSSSSSYMPSTLRS